MYGYLCDVLNVLSDLMERITGQQNVSAKPEMRKACETCLKRSWRRNEGKNWRITDLLKRYQG